MGVELIISVVLILLLIFLGVGLPFSFLSGCIVYTAWTAASFGTFVQTSFKALNSYSIIAMPLFMICGTLIDRSGVAETLIRAAEKLVGKLKGGMAMTIPVVACFFGALSGSGTATVTTLSTMMVPKLERRGYKRYWLAALVAAAGPLGYMIPPNVNALIFNTVSSASVSGLFLATILPGIIWTGAFLVMIRFTYRKYYDPAQAAVAEQEEQAAIQSEIDANGGKKPAMWKKLIPAILMPVIIMGGIYGGIFSATEAGAVGCLYALIIGVFVFRKFTLKGAVGAFVEAGNSMGSVMIMFPMTYIFSRILVVNGIPDIISSWLMGISEHTWIILIVMDFILIIAGFFLDCSVLQLVFVPLLLPLVHSIGMSETQLAVIMFVAIGVGTITPPMAMNIFISARLSGVSTQSVIKPIWPYVFFIGLPMMLLVTFVPQLSTWLPTLVLGSVT